MHTYLFAFSGLCSHQCLSSEKENKVGGKKKTAGMRLSNEAITSFGARIFHEFISAASGLQHEGSAGSPGERDCVRRIDVIVCFSRVVQQWKNP